ncbi:54S ribosomal protein IMG2, mitochondrial [Lachnellula subtilissima]|uniref:Large ribosomal subunit protein mL49 n=1 Tax=Lachnellula subtilissima TaxID=602034 RepID=A0A8H8RVH5_9HELO|nr:54S ribosomal protein IMG2, mitochondrial [Lachnellula subtilissima]
MALAQLPLLFLRPRALPRPSTINHFLGAARASTSAASSTPAPPSLTTAISASKPYRIALTKSKEYPVYQLNKRGGNMHLTKIKHIEGDIDALKADLQNTLKLQDAKDVVIHQLTRHIVVKGHHRDDIKKFLGINQVGFVEVVELL